MNNLTEFQQKILDALPLQPRHIALTRLVTKIYGGGYDGWKKERGRKSAISKALWKMVKLALVSWRSYGHTGWLIEYWYRK